MKGRKYNTMNITEIFCRIFWSCNVMCDKAFAKYVTNNLNLFIESTKAHFIRCILILPRNNKWQMSIYLDESFSYRVKYVATIAVIKLYLYLFSNEQRNSNVVYSSKVKKLQAPAQAPRCSNSLYISKVRTGNVDKVNSHATFHCNSGKVNNRSNTK